VPIHQQYVQYGPSVAAGIPLWITSGDQAEIIHGFINLGMLALDLLSQTGSGMTA
jgi:hypothetical protein